MVARLSREIERRTSNTEKVLALFQSKPLEWIAWKDLGELGGNLAWRSRVADARRLVKARDQGDIEWNRKIHDSRYRYVPYTPLGRDAGTPTLPRWTETGAYQDDGFRLTAPK